MKKHLAYRLSDSAMNDIQSFKVFLEHQKEETVIFVLYKRINKAISLLREFPELGQYNHDSDCRTFSVPKTRYNIIFRVEGAILEILRIYHTSQTEEIEITVL